MRSQAFHRVSILCPSAAAWSAINSLRFGQSNARPRFFPMLVDPSFSHLNGRFEFVRMHRRLARMEDDLRRSSSTETLK